MGANTDSLTLAALAISLVALAVTFLQVAQQYAATAYDFRYCSKRTIGGWSKLSKRKFIWSELRYEVTFFTPYITLQPPSNPDRLTQPSNSSKLTPSSMLPPSNRQYHLVDDHATTHFHASDKPWFLDSSGTVPAAKCSWLSLLQDTTSTDLNVTILKRPGSYDFMASGPHRPYAEIDRKSFLTLLTLLRIKWKNENNGANMIPTGAGRFFEVTATQIVNVGIVYHYQPSPPITFRSLVDHSLFRPTTYIIGSEKARSAMFNSFDLGFHTFRTHSADQTYQSLSDFRYIDSGVASNIQGNVEVNGWAPGLADAIVCWGEASMPKAIDENTDRYVSVYSPIPTGTCFGDLLILKLLITDEPTQSPQESILRSWITDYLQFLPTHQPIGAEKPHHKDGHNDIRTFLTWAIDQHAQFRGSMANHIPWSTTSKQCLSLIHALDDHLNTDLLPTTTSYDIKTRFAGRQISYMCTLFNDASQAGGNWRDNIPTVVARNYIRVADDLIPLIPSDVAQKVVSNRMLRAALWCVHNAWDQDPEWKLCCTLDSRWLADDSTVFIA